MRNLQAKNTTKGMLIWNLCHLGLDFFQNYLYRIPGNGKKTLVWRDNIMGHPPLKNYEEIKEICDCLTQRDFIKPTDISSWDATGNWWAWVLPEIQVHLQNQKTLLINSLTDLAPVHLLAPDKWGWGKNGRYTSARGYNSLQSLQATTDSTSLWKQVWDPIGLPKVNFFFLDSNAQENTDRKKSDKKRYSWTS
jgi:hypothetical protein